MHPVRCHRTLALFPPFQPVSPPSLPLPPPPYTRLWLQSGQAVSLPSSANLDLLQCQQPAPSWKTLLTPRPAAAAAPLTSRQCLPSPALLSRDGPSPPLEGERPETRDQACSPAPARAPLTPVVLGNGGKAWMHRDSCVTV